MPTKLSSRKTKPAAKSQNRADDQTQVSISLGKDLLDLIDQHAESDCRTRSNWIVLKLKAAVAKEKR